MRLKKIEIIGFKSFADRQVIVVDDHVTGVIGPNGCGKSNVVDAIRWCMGEQSAKHLRGSGMSDVIFAGSATRGPGGMAEVTLTLENQGEATGPLAGVPEIALTRRLYADGTSEYLINKIPSRLRDITDLLMGTGVGTKGYSIIEQGQVGRIVSSKPEERRHIIDEAAGITRFKAQKAAAERKIQATRQNLLRTSDVISELESRLETLRRQAQKAERYKRYRSELRDLDLWTASHKYLELQSTGAVLEARRQGLQQAVEDLRAAMQTREEQIAARRVSLTEIEGELSRWQQQVFDLDNKIRLLEAEEEYRRRERESASATAAQARAEAEVAMRGLAHLESELEQVNTQREALGDGEGPEGAQGLVSQRQERLHRLEAELAREQGRVDSARVELGERRAALAGAEARRQSHDEARVRLRTRLGEVETLVTALEDARAQTQQAHDEARDGLAAADAASSRLRARRVELDRRRSELRQHVAAAEVELDTKRAEVHRCRSRLQSLEEIQSRYRGCNSGVQVVMEHREELMARAELDGSVAAAGEGPREAVFGILADYVTAPEHLETALSAMLGDRLEGVVVREPAIAARGVELLKRKQEGRTSFLPREARLPETTTTTAKPEGTLLGWSVPSRTSETGGIQIVDLSEDAVETVVDAPASAFEPTEATPVEAGSIGAQAPAAAPVADDALLDAPGVLGRLADLVSVSGQLGPLARTLVGDAVVVDTLERALELWDRHASASTLVTLEGDRVEPTGVVVGGSPTSLDSALLQQKREIRELQEILAELQDSFEQTRGRHMLLAQQLAEVEAGRERNEAEVIAAEKSRAELASEQNRLAQDAHRQAREDTELRGERERLARELAEREREVEALDEHLTHTRARIVELESTVVAADEQVRTLEQDREREASELTEAKVALARWQQQTDALAQTVERLVRQVEAERQRIERLEHTRTTAESRITELEQASAESSGEREGLVGQSKEATSAVHDARERFDALRLEIDEIEASVRVLRTDVDEKREKLLQDATRMAMDDVGIIPIHIQKNTWAMKRNLRHDARADELTRALDVRPAN